MNLAVGKWHEKISFQEIKNALTEKIHYDADVPSVIEAVSEMYTPVSIFGIISHESREYPELYPGSVSVFLDGSDDLNRNELVLPLVSCLHYFPEGPLAE